ncbi:MAG: futalosine hydrolase [Planctomycetota bacterium]|jgi:futalosine hydrolase
MRTEEGVDRRLDEVRGDGRALLVVAASLEARALLGAFGRDAALGERYWTRHVLRDGVDCVVTGVGKANASGGLMSVLDLREDRVVVSCGVGGVLPGGGCEVGGCVVGSRSVYADEGIETEDGFTACEEMGFGFVHGAGNGSRMGVACDERVGRALRCEGDSEGVIATVSTCAGTDERARGVVERTGAVAEAMEGAAVGVTLANARGVEGGSGVGFVEFRVISNTTGSRSWQRWDLDGAIRVLGERVSGW